MTQADVFFVLGVLLGGMVSLAGLYERARRERIRQEGHTAEGEVLRIDHSGTDRNSYFPVVRYWTPQQQWVTARSSYGNSKSAFRPGEVVRLRFDADDPTRFFIVADGSVLDPWGTILGGLLIMLAACFYYLKS